MRQNKLRVLYWNPNGTNDIEVIGPDGDCIACLPEALFGMEIDGDYETVAFKTAARYIAVSPVNSGRTAIEFLEHYNK